MFVLISITVMDFYTNLHHWEGKGGRREELEASSPVLRMFSRKETIGPGDHTAAALGRRPDSQTDREQQVPVGKAGFPGTVQAACSHMGWGYQPLYVTQLLLSGYQIFFLIHYYIHDITDDLLIKKIICQLKHV